MFRRQPTPPEPPRPPQPDGPDRLPDLGPAPDPGLTIVDTWSLAAWSAFATAVLLLACLVVATVAGRRLLRLQRSHAGELTRLRQTVSELDQRLAAPADGDATPRIGAEDRVFQIGESVRVTEGPHRGDVGTVVESPEWLKPGYVCVDLSGSQARVYMAVSRLAPLQG